LATVFLGTSQFAAAILDRLARSDAHRPALVVTRPDRPRGRGRRPTPPPVAERARELGIPLQQPQSVNDPEARAVIARAVGAHGAHGAPAGGDGPAAGGPLTIVVCAFGALIKEPLLSEHTILNVHPSLLPRWRGAAPVERAIIAGDRETGVSIMRLTAGLDSGPVCLAASEPIRPDDTYGSLSTRLQELGGELILRALEEAPEFVEQPADGVTYAEKIGPADRLLDPSRPASELERVVRALHPHVRAQVELPDGAMLGVHRAAALDDPSDPADLGLRASGDRLLLRCSEGTLELLVVQPPGGRPMDASAYLRGHELPGRR
jgi:methionyl-tRNA formyltransferase